MNKHFKMEKAAFKGMAISLLITLMITLISSCNVRTSEKDDVEDSNRSLYYTKKYSHPIEILKIRDCEYVILARGSMSDMEHYAGCINPIHQ